MLMDIITPVDQMGITLIRVLSSSTCSTVHKLHGSAAVPSPAMSCSGFFTTHALFKNLHKAFSNSNITLVLKIN